MSSSNFATEFSRTYSDDYVNNSFNSTQSAMRRNVSKGNLIADRVESKVLVIYTGGTIGMMRNEKNGECGCGDGGYRRLSTFLTTYVRLV